MLWSIGFLVTFLFGGLTGIILASPPLDFHLSDSYFVVAHFHYVVFGTVVFAMFAGFYFWWPKLTGRMLNERLGKIHFWLTFIGFHTTFLIQHWLGVEGMPRRYADYLPEDGFTLYNRISSIGAFILGASMLVVPLERVDHPQGAQGAGRRPVGLRRLARVGDLLPTAAAQLPVAAADPLRAPRLRPAPPRGRGRRRHPAGRQPGRDDRRRSGPAPLARHPGLRGDSSEDRDDTVRRRGVLLRPARDRLRHRHELARAGRRRRPVPHGGARAADRPLLLDHLSPDRPPPRGRRRTPTSPRARASRACSPPTRGGRCRSALAAALVFTGLAVGWWLVAIAMVFGAIALVGWVYEFYRGEHAH